MDSDRLNRWLTLIANLAVVAGILFLAVELRQNNVLLQAEARSNRTANVQQFNEMMVDPSIASLVIAAADPNSMSAVDSLRYSRFMRWMFISWEAEYLDYQSGLSDWINIEGYKNSFRWVPGLRDEWDQVRDRRNPEFADFLDREVLDK